MSKRKSTAPYNSLSEIEYRKQQLRDQIKRQEKILAKDMDAYEDDIETFKKVWQKVKGVRHLGKNISASGIAQTVQAVGSLPFIRNNNRSSNKPGWVTAFTLGSQIARWLIQWRRNRKK
ncbi:MAG: hypothetical protein K6A41_04835 [Bacteroidales bacterium]|nr:hypothetical protein [Bacteroidales bacterium]